jgi:hypothetical protein
VFACLKNGKNEHDVGVRAQPMHACTHDGGASARPMRARA